MAKELAESAETIVFRISTFCTYEARNDPVPILHMNSTALY